MTAYYNEHDENAAAWLRELIKEGHIADGIVDTRSIVAVEAADLRDFDQCHFFAGIGVWSYALRLSGWADDRPVWTGSCPCQPFSAAGKREGFADERHLWPAFHRLIAECRPPTVLGEQVASKDGLAWLDTVFADLEGSGYAAAAADLCAAGVGAPHIRQRLYFVGRLADTLPAGRAEGWTLAGDRPLASSSSTGRMEHAAQQQQHGRRDGGPSGRDEHPDAGAARGLGHDDDAGLEGQRGGHPAEGGRLGAVRPAAEAGEPRGLADAAGGRHREHQRDGGTVGSASSSDAGKEPEFRGASQAARHSCEDSRMADAEHDDGRADLAGDADGRPGPVNGHWRDADWLYCRDGRWRPVEPGTFPLAHGSPARVGRLRGYGNAIVPQVAAAFIEAVM